MTVLWIILAIAALYVIGGALAVAILLRITINPGLAEWYRSLLRAPTDPFELDYRGDPRTALGLDFAQVYYSTEMGDTDAWFVPAGDAPTHAIYVHGIGGLRENGYKQLSALHAASMPTLMITYRNDTRPLTPKGSLHSFGLNEWRDLEAAVGWTLRHGATRVVLAADSMGGGLVGQFLAHSALSPHIVALVLDAPALDFPAAVAAKLGGRWFPPARWVTHLGIAALRLLTGINLGDAVATDGVLRFPGPVFLAHGTADILVPVWLTDDLAAKRKGPTVYVRTRAHHLRSVNEDPTRYLAGIRSVVDRIGASDTIQLQSSGSR